eukprot:gene7246-biopygen14072
MNSCHEEGVCDRNRPGIEAADPLSSRSTLFICLPLPSK